MEVINTPLKDAKVLIPKVFGDHRGHFLESFNKKKILEIIGNFEFVQDNQSLSSKGVLRGLHFQNPPFEQGKLVRVIKGSVLDVIVDIRKSSPTYGKSFSVELTEENFKMLWIPPGFGHGFATLEDNTIFAYKVTNYYNKESEGCINWADNDLNIDWKIENPIISEKDKEGQSFNQFQSLFS
jgi:dTDP-4-dehydrorhamnose 3,5-epimerase